MIRFRVVVTGTVQGVFFRDSCRRQAVEREVSGWVRNLADGSVEAVFEGAPEDVEAMIDWSRQGPERARVTAVDLREETPEGLVGFAVVS